MSSISVVILVVIPTYNEVENIAVITARLRAAVPDAHILIADDNSPDGTGRSADELAAADDHIHVLHRLGKEGLGAAYLAGFAWGLEHGFEVLVECDADGSHQPEQLPRAAGGAGRTPTWSRARAGCRAARSSTGRSRASSCPAAAVCGPG